MTIVGLDDTDSRERGMCTTYVATQIAERLRRECRQDNHPAGEMTSDSSDPISRLVLVRLNPAVEYKTRGNAALAIHIDCDPHRAFSVACETLASLAETADDRTNPGLVVADHDENTIPKDVSEFSRRAIREHIAIDEAATTSDRHGYRTWHAGDGRGRIGALAAIGAWAEYDEWTYEYISYRDSDRWGTGRDVDAESVLAAADWGYPDVWDTIDREESETVCVPHTPGPILHGIRGDDPDAVRAVADRIESEPVVTGQLFVTNQGTDAHLRHGRIGDTRDGRAYRLEGRVASPPETRRGGHVFFDLENESNTAAASPHTTGDGPTRIQCVAFEPTKRFRDRVRALRVGDRLTVCGELACETLKLEKFAVRKLVDTESVTPTCPDCGRSMKSAGHNQGYRCRACATSAPEKETVTITRDLEEGWYEVPPCARRHIAKPLVRGGFDAAVHPEK